MFSMSERNAVQHPVKQALAMAIIVSCKNSNDQVDLTAALSTDLNTPTHNKVNLKTRENGIEI